MIVVFIYLYIILTHFTRTGLSQHNVDVAFTLGQSNHLYLTHGEQIALNKAITSVSATITREGSFICEKPGLYAFHFYSLARHNSRVWIDLYRNSEYLVSLFGFASDSRADGGNSVLLRLNTEDEIKLTSRRDFNTTLEGADNEIYTTFTGVLLYYSGMEHDEQISFSVGLNHHFHAQPGDTIVFNSVLTSTVGYRVSSGIFTAAVDGIYLFHYHALSRKNQTVFLDLYRNGGYINSIYAHTENFDGGAGNTAILTLQAGDTVHVQARGSVQLFGLADQVYATFSGHLLTMHSHGMKDSQSEVSFSAGLSHHFTGTDLIFDRIFSNSGAGYNAMTGKFTAKENGLYVFHFHALSKKDHEVWVDLYKNNLYIESLFGKSDHAYAAGSNAVVLDLIPGDTVYLKSRKLTNSYFGMPDQIYCTFSGYRVDSGYPSIGHGGFNTGNIIG